MVFAVCGGYQLLGHAYELGGERLPGVGLVDLETVREDGPRLIGNVAIEVDLGGLPKVLAGFENHGGRTRLGAAERPLGRVLKGHGNDGRSGFEGIRGGPRGTVVGTYLHGPLLPEEQLVRGLAHRHRAAPRPGRSWRGSTTRSRTPRTRPPAAPRGSDRRRPSIRWGSILRPLPGTSS